MDHLLASLRAAAEPTRLRLLALCAERELTVGELTQILGQSQPGISRHLKLLCEGGLLDRYREGSSVLYRLARGPGGAVPQIPAVLVDLLPAHDPLLQRDRERLQAITTERERSAAAYFAQNAHRWAAIRSLHVPEADVEARLLELMTDRRIDSLLDIGTGTGRILELLAPYYTRAVGIDQSRDMLAIARVNLDRAQCRHGSVRLGDMYALPFAAPAFSHVVVHQVLHFAERPGEAILEAARVLAPGGRLVIVDFAPHALETLRSDYAHRRLGFTDADMQGWMRRAGLTPAPSLSLPGDPLTVVIWVGDRRANTASPEAVLSDLSVQSRQSVEFLQEEGLS